VTLTDYCKTPYLAATAQTSLADYLYEGVAAFKLTPFAVSPAVCKVNYSCTQISGDHDFCLYSDELTASAFNTETGNFTFQSVDFDTYGNQTLVFEITG